MVDHGRLVTKVIYLEDPEQAIPIKLPKDQIPSVTLNPTERPLKVAQALGRVMAIVRIGGRRPTVEEINAGATGDLGLDACGRRWCDAVSVHQPGGRSAVRFLADRSAVPHRLPAGPGCPATSTSATAAITEHPPALAVTATSRASTRATPS